MLAITFGDAMLSVLIGVGTGIASSYLVWRLLTHGFQPKVEVCESLARFDVRRDDGHRCQTKIANRGRRSAVDVRVVGRLAVSGLVRPGVTEWMTLLDVYVPELSPQRHRRWSVSTRTASDRAVRRIRDGASPAHLAVLDDGKSLHLDELLSYGEEAQFVLTVISRDSFSGSPGFARRDFTARHLTDGRFEDGSGCGVVAEQGGQSTSRV